MASIKRFGLHSLNTITATATDTSGNTETASVNVTAITTGDYITITGTSESGLSARIPFDFSPWVPFRPFVLPILTRPYQKIREKAIGNQKTSPVMPHLSGVGEDEASPTQSSPDWWGITPSLKLELGNRGIILRLERRVCTHEQKTENVEEKRCL
jgi:hypothetical protein